MFLSGGPDSATLAAWAKKEGRDYQSVYLKCGHSTDQQEIVSADRVAANNNSQLEIVDISRLVGALGGQRILIHSQASIMPFGNAIVLSLGITYALKTKADSILLALHGDDAAENVEYTRGFIDSVEKLARSAGHDVHVETPFIKMNKKEVFALGARLGVDYSGTWSCVRPGEIHCGVCAACRARYKALSENGLEDRTIYEQPVLALQSALAAR